MPRIKQKGLKKMLKLQSLSDLAKVKELVVPDKAFAPDTKLEVPEGAFNARPKKGEYPCYVKYVHNKTNDGQYASFVFLKSFLQKNFKKFDPKERFELVQGAAPHKDWFMLRKAVVKKGNRVVTSGVLFHTTDYLKAEKMDKATKYPLEHLVKDGVVYVKLPPELVQLLR